MPLVEIKMPVRGLSEALAFSKQIPLTTREQINWWMRDARTGRERGASRCGLSKYASATVSGAARIQDLQSVVVDNRRQTYAISNPPTREWGAPLAVASDIVDAVTDRRGNVYYIDPNIANSGSQGFIKLNQDGVELARATVDFDPLGTGVVWYLHAIAVDDSENVYIGISDATGGSFTRTMVRIWKFRKQIDGTYLRQWIINPLDPTAPTLAIFVQSLVVYRGSLYALCGPGQLSGSVSSPACIVDRYDGIDGGSAPAIAKRIDINSAGGAGSIFSPDTGGVFPLQLAIRDKGAIEYIVCGMAPIAGTARARFVLKADENGKIVWKLRASDGAVPYAPGPGAIGVAVAVDREFNVYSFGPTASGDVVKVRRLVDNGATVSTTGAGTWTANPASSEAPYRRMVADQFSNLHLGLSPGAAAPYFQVYSKAGAILTTLTAAGVGQNTSSVALPPDITRLSGDPQIAEFAYLAGQDTGAQVQKVRLMSVTSTSGSARTMKVLAVAGGNIKIVPPGGVPVSPAGAGTLAQPELDATAPYVMSVALSSPTIGHAVVFYTDGKRLVYYDPVTDTVVEWKSNTIGGVPQRCKILDAWRGRAMLLRPSEDAHNFFGSAKDNPFDFDFGPTVLTPTTAFAGNASAVGRCPDIINAFIPWSDDLAFLGGDHSIWRFTGDPMAGGQIDLVSDTTGIAFGYSWAKDENGLLYFFGSRGGVYRMAPDGLPERISADWIDRRLSDIDLATHYTLLEWDVRRDALMAFVVNQTSGIATSSYVWERTLGTWSELKFADATRQPTAALVIDGDDPDDRRLLIGCEDGYVRMFDESARDDDGAAIDWRVLIGPYSLDADGKALLFNQFSFVLADDQGGCFLELIPSQLADILGHTAWRGRLHPGENDTIFRRTRGNYFYLRLQNREVGVTTAFESANMTIEQAGMRRGAGV